MSGTSPGRELVIGEQESIQDNLGAWSRLGLALGFQVSCLASATRGQQRPSKAMLGPAGAGDKGRISLSLSRLT